MAEGRELIRLEQVRVPLPGAAGVLITVDWTLREGEFWVVGGLNGSGKSTWLSTAAGLYPPGQGHQWIFGRDTREMVERDRAEIRSNIGFVFENTGRLFAELNVAENVALPLSYRKNCPAEDVLKEVSVVLDACGLSDYAASEPSVLSRGMQRRVALARALIMGPDLLMIDSPLTSQDPQQSRWWVDFLDSLRKDEHAFKTPSTVVVTTEEFGPWLASDRQFVLIDSGEFHVLGDRSSVTGDSRPVVREMWVGR